jgi:hypothetical protein
MPTSTALQARVHTFFEGVASDWSASLPAEDEPFEARVILVVEQWEAEQMLGIGLITTEKSNGQWMTCHIG